MTKRLADLLSGVSCQLFTGRDSLTVTGVTVDSRRVKPGDLFVAIKGVHHDGHDHAGEVARAGAVAILAERSLGSSIPVFIVPSTTAALSGVAARFYDHPARSLDIVGVTGTNGKTTITYLLESIWLAEGLPGAVLGTIDYRWPNTVEKAVNTTPHALDVQRLLAAVREGGFQRVAMEASSHALALGRVDDVCFSVGVFTNLTQDHLDFHGDMEGYFSAKAKLFERLADSPRPIKRAVINRDDPWGERFIEKTRVPVWTYGLEGPADFSVADLVLSAGGSCFRVVTPQGETPVHLSLVGRYNVYNALAAMAAAMALGTPLETAVRGVESMAGVPGRLERVTEHPAGSVERSGLPFNVFVDFAHTEDALRNVLEAVRPLTKNKLFVLFGCGGDRDRTKRPKMGELAARLADHVVVTSDNPRSEDPSAIAREVEAGVCPVTTARCDVIVDRREAIRRVLLMAQDGDVVLLAGKGHETYQIFKDHTEDFDDRTEVRHVLAGMKK